MRALPPRRAIAVILAIASLSPSVAQAYSSDETFMVLEYFGLQFYGSQDILRDNVNANVTIGDRTVGLIFATLAMNGSLTATSRSSFRGVPNQLFTINSSNTLNQARTPMAYTLTVPVGRDEIVLDGEILLNVTNEIDLLGDYETTIQISNRSTFTRTPFEGDPITTPIDYDVGPIHFSGNIYEDLFGRLNLPFLGSSNQESPAEKSRIPVLPRSRAPAASAAVPEPPSLILLLLGIGALRSRRHGRS